LAPLSWPRLAAATGSEPPHSKGLQVETLQHPRRPDRGRRAIGKAAAGARAVL